MKQRAQPWLGTLVEIRIWDALPEDELNGLFQQAFDAIRTVHEAMSFHQADSDISRYNRAAPGSCLPVQAPTVAVLQAAQDWQQCSAGMFDIRVAARLVAGNMLPAPTMPVPSFEPQQIAYRLLPGLRVEKLSADWIDVGGIAKGYAVDLAWQVLQAGGVQSAVVNAGGDLRVLGTHTVAVRDPQAPVQMAHSLSLQNQAMATSATYFSRKGSADDVSGALFDGRNGSAIASAHSYSVMAPECMQADALTKILAISGDVQHPLIVAAGATALIV